MKAFAKGKKAYSFVAWALTLALVFTMAPAGTAFGEPTDTDGGNPTSLRGGLGHSGVTVHSAPEAIQDDNQPLDGNHGPLTLAPLVTEPTATFNIQTGVYTDGSTHAANNTSWASNVLTVNNGANIAVTGTSSDRLIEVAGDATATITLNDVSIASFSNDQSPLLLNDGANVTLLLAEGSENTLTLSSSSGAGMAGIQAPAGTTLTIDGTGNLTAVGGWGGGAGIGGGTGESGGNITISGGTVTATGGLDSAGVGGGSQGTGGNITISGGTVVARGQMDAAGVGGGVGGAGGTINISGGTVTATGATGGGSGAGIGGGRDGDGGTIKISGGMITAVANSNSSSGIGGGQHGNGGDIAISGGMVIATGGENAVGIGNYGNYSTIGTLNMTGNAIVFANSVSADVTSDDEAGGILLIGGVMNWYGGETITIDYDATIPGDRSIIIPQWKTLSIDDEITFTNDGYIFGVVVGTVAGEPAVAPTRTIDLSAPISETSPPPYGIKWDRNGDVYTVVDGADIEVVGNNQLPDPTQRRIEVAASAEATITLKDVSITGLGNTQSPLFLNTGADVEIVLAEDSENILTAGDSRAGIEAPAGTTLTIRGAGSLNATGGNSAAGIGGRIFGSGGTINISDVTALTATGGAGPGSGAAGIGGGNQGSGGTINISNVTTLTATGGSTGGAGIGSGRSSTAGGGTITISGVTTLTATGGNGAGIGGGWGSDGGTITISDVTTLTATGGADGAGIGGGRYGAGGTIAISDITALTATGGSGGALALGHGADSTGGIIAVTGVYGYWTNASASTDPGGAPTNRTFFGDKETFATEKGYKYIKLDGNPDLIDMASLALLPTHSILTEKSTSPAVVDAVTTPEGFFDFRRVSWSVDKWSGSLGTEYSIKQTGDFDEVITVSEDGANGTDVAVVTVAPNGGSVRVLPASAWKDDDGRKAHTIRVRASYEGGAYMATATIELMPDAELPARAAGEPSTEGLHTSVRVLEPTVAVNRAMARGALVPILITQQEPADMGLTAFDDDGGGTLAEPEHFMPSLPEIGAMRLVTGTGANVREVAGYKVEIPPEGDRFIEITVPDETARTAKNTKNVRLQILRAKVGDTELDPTDPTVWAVDANRVPVIGQFNLTVSNKFPKVTLRAGDLNLLFPTESSTVTATSTAGAVDVLSLVETAKTQTFRNNIALKPSEGGNLTPATVKLVLKDGTDPTAPEPVLAKAGTQRGRATVQVAGFKPQEVALNVKVVNAAPNVRFERGSIALHYPGTPIDELPTVQPDPESPNRLLKDDFTPAVVNLISGVRNGVFEDGYKVKRVEINHTDPDQFNLRIEPYDPAESGAVKLTPLGAVPKNVPLRVIFHDPAFSANEQDNPLSDTKFRNLSLKVTMRASTALNVTNKATPVAVNRNHVSRLADGSDDEYETEWIIREIPIGLNADNIILGDWKVQGISETSKTRTPWLNPRAGEDDPENPSNKLFPELVDANNEKIPPVRVEPYKSGIRLYAHKAALEDLMERGKTTPYDENINPRNMTYRMLIGSDKIRDKNDRVRTFAVNLTFTANNPTFTVSLNSRTRIDVANPVSFQTATVRLTGTTAEIASVKLYPTAKNNDERPTESTDFIAVPTGSLTFNIAKHPDNPEVVPKVRQNLSVQITLTNGQVLNSWTEVRNGRNSDRTIGVTALQAVQRATSRTVTLYRSQPLQGADFDAFIGTPAGSSLGYYGIDQARLDSFRLGKPVSVTDGGTTSIGYEKYGDPDSKHHGGLVLARTGETTYALSFQDGIAPGATLHKNYPTNKTTTKLNSNYPIRVELWAEGTYQVARDPDLTPDPNDPDADPNADIILDPATGKPLPAIDPTTGKVIPLRNAKNKAMTTPTVYNVRVNIR
ncbi:MAG: carbohydrate-binding domain-containing protein [Clostridiales bacterium]|nr:carbohydrate-binding domain-containing protein [Clostridiales bacterium]